MHRLAKVAREDVILPRKTLAMLDRNVAGFIMAREQLKSLRFQARKGLLVLRPAGDGQAGQEGERGQQRPDGGEADHPGTISTGGGRRRTTTPIAAK